MRFLIRNIFILTTALSVLLASIIGATYRDTNHWVDLVLNANRTRCSAPCLFGITPITDQFKESADKIKAHPLLRPTDSESYQEGFAYVFMGQKEVTTFYSTSKSRMALTTLENDGFGVYSNSLKVEFYNAAPSLADVLFLLGVPSELGINYDKQNGNGSIFFFFEIQQSLYTMTIPFNDLSASLSPDSKIKLIRFSGLQTPSSSLKGNWKGFKTYSYYLEMWNDLSK